MKFKDLIQGKVYEVEWIDHNQLEDVSLFDAVSAKDCILKSAGYFIGHTKNYVLLAYNYESLESKYNDVMRLFKKGILRIKKL